MIEIIGLILAFMLVLVGLLAFFTVVNILFPARIEKTRRNADRMPARSFVVGLVNFAFFFALALAFFALGNAFGAQFLHIIALFVLVFPTVGIVFGLGGVVELVGERLAPEQSSVRRTWCAALATSLACALPFVGWFGLLPYISLLGMGAFIISLFQRQLRNAVQEDVAQEDNLA